MPRVGSLSNDKCIFFPVVTPLGVHYISKHYIHIHIYIYYVSRQNITRLEKESLPVTEAYNFNGCPRHHARPIRVPLKPLATILP